MYYLTYHAHRLLFLSHWNNWWKVTITVLWACSGSTFPSAEGNVPCPREFHTQVISGYPLGSAAGFVIAVYLPSTANELSFVHCVRKARRAWLPAKLNWHAVLWWVWLSLPYPWGLPPKAFPAALGTKLISFANCTFKPFWGTSLAEKLGLKSAAVGIPVPHS